MATQSWFEGAWTIRREIVHVGGPTNRFVGRAVFRTDGEGLEQGEEGLLEVAGRLYPAERRYLWRFEADGRIRVLFDDGRAFHSFRPGQPVADHLCGDDRYAVAYAFGDDGWTSRWEVRGPRKDYVMTSSYRRVRPGQPALAGVA